MNALAISLALLGPAGATPVAAAPDGSDAAEPQPSADAGAEPQPSAPPAPGEAPPPPAEPAPPPPANAVAAAPGPMGPGPMGPGPAAARAMPMNETPLPPPPPPVPPEVIDTRPWRGEAWLSFSGVLNGPVDGARNRPASANATAMGFSTELGYRPHRQVGLGIGVTHIAHDVDVVPVVDQFGLPGTVTFRGNLTAWELLILRVWFKGGARVQPFVEAASGVATIRQASGAPTISGVHLRVGAGFDAWIAPRWSLDFGVLYRLIGASAVVGHTLGGRGGLTYHW